MLLQTYLYYSCDAFVYWASAGETDILFHGLEKICSYCEAWERFFAPTMFNFAMKKPENEWSDAWSAVRDTEDCVTMLLSRCRELFRYRKEGNINAVRRRQRELVFTMKSLVLPCFHRLNYANPESAYVVWFPKTEKFLTSIVSLETSSTLSLVPGVFDADERQVVMLYLDAIKSAPSFVAASGVEGSSESCYYWAPMVSFEDRYELTPTERKMLVGDINRGSIIRSIYESWRKETVQ